MAIKSGFRELVRVADKDVKGHVPIVQALSLSKGTSHMFANAICVILKIDRQKKVGDFSQDEMDKIENVMRNPIKNGIPAWLCNRRKDRETGEDKHLISSDLDLTKKFDIRFLKKIRTYRGLRHAKGLKVRGQRTKTTGGKGSTLGVARKKKSGKKG